MQRDIQHINDQVYMVFQCNISMNILPIIAAHSIVALIPIAFFGYTANTGAKALPREHEVVDNIVAGILRQKKPYERMMMALEANKTVRLLLKTTLYNQHPDWNEQQIKEEVARRMLYGTD